MFKLVTIRKYFTIPNTTWPVIPCLFILLLLLNPSKLLAGTVSHTGPISQDMIWDSSDTHLIEGDMTIPADLTLTILPGTQLQFNNNTRIHVTGGSLNIQGTEANPVVLTSTAAAGERGSWRGIQVTSGSANIENAHISNFTNYGVYFSGETTTGLIKDSVIDNLNQTGSCIYLNNASPMIQGNTLTNCSNGIYVNNASPMIQGNTVTNSTNGVYLYKESNPIINGGNIITENRYGIMSNAGYNSGYIGPQPEINRNQIYSNSSYNYYLGSNWRYVPGYALLSLNTRENWWGTTDIGEIQSKIYDRNDTTSLPTVDFSEYFITPDGGFEYIPPEITSVSNPTEIRSGQLTVQAIDTSGIDRVDFYLDGIQLATQVSGAGYRTVLNFIQIGEGTHALTYTVYDGQQNSTSGSISIDINYQPPAIPVITLPADGATVGATGIAVSGTADSRSRALINVDDDLATETVLIGTAGTETTIQLYLGNNPFGDSVNVASNGLFQQSVTLTEAESSFTVRSSTRGGQSDLSTAVTVTLDQQGPSISSLTYNDINFVDGSELTQSGVFVALVSDQGNISRVVFTLDGNSHTDVNGTDGYTLPLTLTSLTEGSHTLVITAYDSYDNAASLTLSFSVTVAPPQPPVITTPEDGLVTNQASITVSGIAEPSTTIQFLVNGSVVSETVVANAQGQYQGILSLVEGTNNIAATATNRGGTGQASSTVSVIQDLGIPQAPANLSVSTSNGSEITLNWLAVEAQPEVVGYRLYRAIEPFDDVANAEEITTGLYPGTGYTDLPDEDGQYYYRVLAENGLGTQSPLSNKVTGGVDNTPPRAVSIEYTTSGNFDTLTGRMAPGNVAVTLTVSEPLLVTPFLSLTPTAGVPITVSLSKNSETEYTGTFEIKTTTPEGTAYAVFSARDLANNRGTLIETGSSINIDTIGPVVTVLTINPDHPVQNDTASPVTVNLTIELDESVKEGSLPTLGYTLSGSGRNAEVISNMTSSAARHWSASFVLPGDAGLNEPELLQFTFSAADDLDNPSTKISAANSFQVYQGGLPPLDYPRSLQGSTVAGGQINLSWKSVDEAADYQVYRQAPNETTLAPLARSGGELSYTDQTNGNGTYLYAVASIRTANSQESGSSQSPAIEVDADATAPAAPTALQLQLNGSGIWADWQHTNVDGVLFALYRSSADEITSIEGMTPILTNIRGLAIIDPSPSPAEHSYAITAVDPAGNESIPSQSAYLNFNLLPVNSLMVTQDEAQLPVVKWSHAVPASIAGYKVILNNNQPLHEGLLAAAEIVDSGYDNGERLYTIIVVDENDTESLGRSVRLPKLIATLADGTQLKRGIMNRLGYTVINDGTTNIDDIHIITAIAAHNNQSEKFSLAAGESKTVEVILGGYQDLDGLSNLQTTLRVTPNTGEEIRVIRRQDILVGEAGLAISIATREFTRGATGQVQFTLNNTSDVEIELFTATANNSQPSNELRLKLMDQDGNVFSNQRLQQISGDFIVTLANGSTVARIPAGETFISEWLDVNVTSASPDNIDILLEIDKLHYHLGKPDQASIATNLETRQAATLIETSYFGEITGITPENSFGGEPIVISGRAVNRGSQQSEYSVPLKLIIAANGFERVTEIQTVADGTFSHTFEPLQGESGVYSVSVIHPDIQERPQQAHFTIGRLVVGPAVATFNIPHNLDFPGHFRYSTGRGNGATNVRLEYNASDQEGGQLPPGITITLPEPVNMTAHQNKDVTIGIVGDETAATEGQLVLVLKSDETGDQIMAEIKVHYTFSEATPVLDYSPAHLETGVVYNGIASETLTLQNKGLTRLQNTNLTLLTQNGQPAPVWVKLISVPQIGDMAVGDISEIQLSFEPNDTVYEGVHKFKLRVSSDNYQTTDIPISVAVTQSGIGNALIRVSDIYTATLDDNGDIIRGVKNARVKLINDKVITIEKDLRTDNTGEALFTDLVAGTYRYRVSADNHEDKTGTFSIKPGITVAQDIFIDYKLITVEWSVNEITLQDIYEITLFATFQTDVPAAVVVASPSSIRPPNLRQGDVYYGEFTLTNHGLIRADNLEITLPRDDQFFDFELVGGLPDYLDAKEVLTVPYRAIMRQSFEPDGTNSGGGCFTYINCAETNYSYQCANGSISSSATNSPHCLTWTSSECNSQSGGAPVDQNYGGDGGGGVADRGGFGGTIDTEPGIMVCRPDCNHCPDSDNGAGY